MGHVYASSDWHGCKAVAEQVFNFLKDDDVLFLLGDCQDRGENGIWILNEIMNRANITYIKGNHDQLMHDALLEANNNLKVGVWYENDLYSSLWFINGGNITFDNSDINKKNLAGSGKYIEFIEKLPTEITYRSPQGHTIILEHAGYTPYGYFNSRHDPLWDREHFLDCWAGEKDEQLFLVHGHTPVQYLRFMYGYNSMEPLTEEEMKARNSWHVNGYIPHIIRYCDGHKFDIDLCTIVSKRIALLDLDNFEEIYFNERGVIENGTGIYN